MGSQDYVLLKVFNNNVILTEHGGIEKILIKQGIGFGRHAGDTLDRNIKVDKVFTIENAETRDRFKQLIKDIDDPIVGICEEIIYMISSELQDPLDEGIHIRLTDHIAFTLYRLQKRDEISNPFIVEIETLYPEEWRIAQKTVEMLAKRLGVFIPEDETGFIALHIHTAKGRGKVSNTLKYAYISSSIIEMLEDELGMRIDRKSIDYARFISHIRFALERMIKNIPIKNDLLSSIKRAYKDSYRLSKKVAGLIEQEMKEVKVSPEEMGYITMHIEKLKNASQFK